jgi:hypothetical protein
VRANCDAAGCTVECSQDEVLITAYCGARRTPAIFPTERSASCSRPGTASNPLVAACVKASLQPADPVAHDIKPTTAVARDFPKLDVGGKCRAAANRDNAVLESCTADEQRAREQLATQWGQFVQPDRTRCTQLSSMRGFESYVELLTCLEMARDAKQLPKQ